MPDPVPPDSFDPTGIASSSDGSGQSVLSDGSDLTDLAGSSDGSDPIVPSDSSDPSDLAVTISSSFGSDPGSLLRFGLRLTGMRAYFDADATTMRAVTVSDLRRLSEVLPYPRHPHYLNNLVYDMLGLWGVAPVGLLYFPTILNSLSAVSLFSILGPSPGPCASEGAILRSCASLVLRYLTDRGQAPKSSYVLARMGLGHSAGSVFRAWRASRPGVIPDHSSTSPDDEDIPDPARDDVQLSVRDDVDLSPLRAAHLVLPTPPLTSHHLGNVARVLDMSGAEDSD